MQQDPREKLEMFPRLGYYFIVFRAIDARYSAVTTDKLDPVGDLTVVNVYLAVFREGICSVRRFTPLIWPVS